jgi:hypothetical protein
MTGSLFDRFLLSGDSLISSYGLPRALKLMRLSKSLPGNTGRIERHVYVGIEARYLVMDRVPMLVMMMHSRSTIITEVIFKNGILLRLLNMRLNPVSLSSRILRGNY